MELRHLRYFVAVAEDLHFRRAAERLHVAQPAVSEQVRKLEQELGVRLFDRSQRCVSLTAAGSALLVEARSILRHADVAQQAARTASQQATMRMRIGYLPDALPTSVSRALRHLATAAPAVEVDLTTGPAARLIDDVRGDRLDAAVTMLPAATNGLRVTLLGDHGVVAVLPVTHPRAVDRAIRLERLVPDRLVVLPRPANPAFHDTVAAMCRDASIAPTFVELPEAQVEHVLLSVAAGAGVALLPGSAAERFASPGVRFVPVEGPSATCQSAALTRRDADNVVTAGFVRCLTRQARPPLALAPTDSAPDVSLAS
jgi:DNA-binding transcriptional LysR family regulator